MIFDPKTNEILQVFKKNLPEQNYAEVTERERKVRETNALKRSASLAGQAGASPAPAQGKATAPSPTPKTAATCGQHDFYNPYHFVPVFKPDATHWVDKANLTSENRTHSKYLPLTDDKKSGLTGRLICKLTTVDPVFIGATRVVEATKTTPAKLKHFELKDGEPAIPASTLRGLISSIAETASNSAMRVLTDSVLSYRKAMKPEIILSALGMIIKEGKDYELRPLAMPTLQLKDNDNFYQSAKNNKVNEIAKCYILPPDEGYENIFAEPRLKVYVGNYNGLTPDAFLTDKKSFDIDNPEYYYLKLKKDWNFVKGVLKTDSKLHCKNAKFVVGQKSDGVLPITEQKLNVLIAAGTAKKDDYTRGILRILGKDERQIPSGKKHELFIPYPEGVDKWPMFPIPQPVVERFHLLADERTEASDPRKPKEKDRPLNPAEEKALQPYSLYGAKRNGDANEYKYKLRLKHGDIVHFKPSVDGKSIEEVAFSSIWRGCVLDNNTTATVRHFFEKTVDKELLPFNNDRKMVSPAELLFGFVQEDKKAEKKVSEHNNVEKKAGKEEENLAYAGRLRFSFGKLGKKSLMNGFYKEEVHLKILSSPKPPCPAMYFMNKKVGNGNRPTDFIPKHELNPKIHEPQGRKFYLHKQADATEPWKTKDQSKNAEQKVSIKPMKPGLDFYFHIDFDNLTEWELGLLCYSLKPNNEFMHKLGMGKSIGLGKVEITPQAIFFIDRVKRYSEGDLFSVVRYHDARRADATDANDWPEGYEQEANSPTSPTSWAFVGARAAFADTMNPDIKKAIELLGDPAKIVCSVHTPQIKNAPNLEMKTYQWFVVNEKSSKQSLTPLDGSSTEIKPLERI